MYVLQYARIERFNRMYDMNALDFLHLKVSSATNIAPTA